MYLTVVLLQCFTQLESETLPIGQKFLFLHGDRRVSCKCHSCASISLCPPLVCHVLRVCTVIAIEHNYGVSVLMLYLFSVLMEDASVCRPARPWDALHECSTVHDISSASSGTDDVMGFGPVDNGELLVSFQSRVCLASLMTLFCSTAL